MLNVDLAWDNFLKGIDTNKSDLIKTDTTINNKNNKNNIQNISLDIPKCSNIYISTKTMIAHLSNKDILNYMEIKEA